MRSTIAKEIGNTDTIVHAIVGVVPDVRTASVPQLPVPSHVLRSRHLPRTPPPLLSPPPLPTQRGDATPTNASELEQAQHHYDAPLLLSLPVVPVVPPLTPALWLLQPRVVALPLPHAFSLRLLPFHGLFAPPVVPATHAVSTRIATRPQPVASTCALLLRPRWSVFTQYKFVYAATTTDVASASPSICPSCFHFAAAVPLPLTRPSGAFFSIALETRLPSVIPVPAVLIPYERNGDCDGEGAELKEARKAVADTMTYIIDGVRAALTHI